MFGKKKFPELLKYKIAASCWWETGVCAAGQWREAFFFFFFSCRRKSDDCVWQTVACEHMSFNLHEIMVFMQGTLLGSNRVYLRLGCQGKRQVRASFTCCGKQSEGGHLGWTRLTQLKYAIMSIACDAVPLHCTVEQNVINLIVQHDLSVFFPIINMLSCVSVCVCV